MNQFFNNDHVEDEYHTLLIWHPKHIHVSCKHYGLLDIYLCQNQGAGDGASDGK